MSHILKVHYVKPIKLFGSSIPFECFGPFIDGTEAMRYAIEVHGADPTPPKDGMGKSNAIYPPGPKASKNIKGFEVNHLNPVDSWVPKSKGVV
jgi:hypothetical protein